MKNLWDIVNDVSERTGHDPKTTRKCIGQILECIIKELEEGGRAEFRGFFTFFTVHVDEITKRNPRTGVPVIKPAHNKVRARTSVEIRRKLNPHLKIPNW